MNQTERRREFTGTHMALIMVVGFGIVAAVNFTMASLAVGGFHGVIVDNTYVASQKFNSWLDEAEADRKLGWSVQASQDAEGYVVLASKGVPDGAKVTAALRRPIGERAEARVTFAALGNGAYRSIEPVGDGRWIMRLSIAAAGQDWAKERELP
ncbi:MAG: FixH family protein [Pseudomonadota bacterium]